MFCNVTRRKYKKHPQSNLPPCAWKGCDKHGEYPAPRSAHNLDDKIMLCLEHVREYNKQWNYFAKMGMDAQQIERYQRESMVGHRPTAKMGVNGHFANADHEVKETMFTMFDDMDDPISSDPVMAENERQAFRILEISPTMDWEKIKQAYKTLAKRYHPDLNGTKNVERLKMINQAYSQLKAIYQ